MAAQKKRAGRAASPQSTNLISDMYARWTLDSLIEVAQAVAADFVSRPGQYTSVPSATAGELENVWYRSGTDPGFPDLAKRQMIFAPFLGPSDGKDGEHASQFHSNSSALRERARAFTERQVETGEDNLRQAFLDEVATSKAYLSTFNKNAVAVNGDRQTKNIFDAGVDILLDSAVAAVFGRTPSTVQGWPLVDREFDNLGARLIEEITSTLQVTSGMISQSQFIVMQRIASFGASTLSELLIADTDPSKKSAIDSLIRKTYSWKTALDALRPNPPEL